MLYLPKPLRLLSNFGKVQLTGRDFVTLCDDNEIELVFSRDTDTGIYYHTPQGLHTIVISSKLRSATRRAWIGWHEFAHYLQNYYNPKVVAAFCGTGEQTPAEKHADNFAFVCTEPNVKLCRPGDFIEMMMMRGGK